MAADPQRIVGSMVEVKACHVTNLAECSCHYGSNSKMKRVQGIVTLVEVIKNSTTNRTTTFVMAAYDLGGTTTSPRRLNIRSVKVGPTPTAATVPTGGGSLMGSTDGDSTTTEAMTPPTATEPTFGGRIEHQHIFRRTYSGGGKGNTTLNDRKQQQYHRQQRHSTSRSSCNGPRPGVVCE